MIDIENTLALNAEYKKHWAAYRVEKRRKGKGDASIMSDALAAIDTIAPEQVSAGTDITGYDRYVVAFSGGKDSLASLLWLLDQGVDKSRIELHHHDVDGREGSSLFDWPVTRSYCQAIANHFEIPLTWSWRIGGIEGEIRKVNTQSLGVKYTTLTGDVVELDTKAKIGTRLMFPAIAADLRTRWCSSLAKIDVFARWLNADTRFAGKSTLVLTGERAQESTNRASYCYAEAHRCNSGKKTVHALRPILHWSESQVWSIIRGHLIDPHPAYKLGFGRVSCAMCIFNGSDEFATSELVAPAQFKAMTQLERDINFTMKPTSNLTAFAAKGQPLATEDTGTQLEYTDSIKTDNWELPAGAHSSGSCGSV